MHFAEQRCYMINYFASTNNFQQPVCLRKTGRPNTLVLYVFPQISEQYVMYGSAFG